MEGGRLPPILHTSLSASYNFGLGRLQEYSEPPGSAAQSFPPSNMGFLHLYPAFSAKLAFRNGDESAILGTNKWNQTFQGDRDVLAENFSGLSNHILIF